MKDFITDKEALSSWKIDEIDLITDALSEQDILMELWHREEKSFFAPAGEWKNRELQRLYGRNGGRFVVGGRILPLHPGQGMDRGNQTGLAESLPLPDRMEKPQ